MSQNLTKNISITGSGVLNLHYSMEIMSLLKMDSKPRD